CPACAKLAKSYIKLEDGSEVCQGCWLEMNPGPPTEPDFYDTVKWDWGPSPTFGDLKKLYKHASACRDERVKDLLLRELAHPDVAALRQAALPRFGKDFNENSVRALEDYLRVATG